MLLAFPIGAYVMFESNIDDNIDSKFPIINEDNNILDFLSRTIGWSNGAIEIELGDIFILIWCIFLILFTVSILGPKKDLFRTISPIAEIKNHKERIQGINNMVIVIEWFSVIILLSVIINLIQESMGIVIESPEYKSALLLLFDVTKAPLIEESVFRILLIGIPLYFIYLPSNISLKHFLKVLWHPNKNLDVHKNKKIIILIVLSAILFGSLHIIYEGTWSAGKITQATAGGIIIGWVYYRYGLAPAVLVHWATNYFIFSYAYMIAEITSSDIESAFSHSLLNTIQILFLITGIISALILFMTKFCNSKQEYEHVD